MALYYYRKSLMNNTFKIVIHAPWVSTLFHWCCSPRSSAPLDPKVSSDNCSPEEEVGELWSPCLLHHKEYNTGNGLPPPPPYSSQNSWSWSFVILAIPWSSLVYNSVLYPHTLWYVLHILDTCCSFCFALKLVLSDFQSYIPWQHQQFAYSLCCPPQAVHSRPLPPSFACSLLLCIIILRSELVRSRQNNRLLLLLSITYRDATELSWRCTTRLHTANLKIN